MNDEIGVLILAGGKSERMLFPKPFLLYEGKTFLRKIIDEYRSAGINNIFLVLNKDFCSGRWEKYVNQIKPFVTIVQNADPELGRTHSLKIGIEKMLSFNFCFIQNIDNPTISEKLIGDMIQFRSNKDYVSPVYNGKSGHPVLVSKKIVQHLNRLRDENFNLRNILAGYSRQTVEVNSSDILANVNTVEDYKRLSKLSGTKKSKN